METAIVITLVAAAALYLVARTRGATKQALGAAGPPDCATVGLPGASCGSQCAGCAGLTELGEHPTISIDRPAPRGTCPDNHRDARSSGVGK